ncbi:MAG: endo-1,4-beta-xylanase, partial [Oscillospiraceae bacterium]|nr:endo-1,4-beta-xylanase [Oscillospiraceae bacterium]
MNIHQAYAHRTVNKTLTFPDAANTEITVKQKKHAFLFGCSEFSSVEYASGLIEGDENLIAEERYERLSALFNSVTLPFYWGRFEPERGKSITEKVKKAAKFWKSKNITLKGHPLCWHTVCADWLMDYPDNEILKIQLDRITRDVTEFAGLIDMWDVINEVVIMPVFEAEENAITPLARIKGRVEMIRMAFEEVKETNPNAIIMLNDFDMSTAYECLIEAVLE